MALKTIFVAGARGIGMHMVSVLLSEMVRPNAPKTSTKTAIIRPNYSRSLTLSGTDTRLQRTKIKNSAFDKTRIELTISALLLIDYNNTIIAGVVDVTYPTGTRARPLGRRCFSLILHLCGILCLCSSDV